MHVHELKPAQGSRKRRTIVGRGPGSGRGKTSGRGHTGQGQRAGRGILRSLEGGQMPLIRRIPKVGFRSHRPIVYQIVPLEKLAQFNSGVVDAKILKDKGLVRNIFKPYKILGDGDIKNGLTVHAYAFSKSAKEKIEKAGGKAEVITVTDLKKQETMTEKKEKSE